MSSLIPEFQPMLRGPVIFTLVLLTTMPLLSPGQTIPVPESIRAENVPPIPTSLSTALSRYQNIRSVSFQDWDDSRGRAMYVSTRFADTPQVQDYLHAVEVLFLRRFLLGAGN